MKNSVIIFYHTNLSGNLNAGPTYSVPKQIYAQSLIDNVYWFNTINIKNDEWLNTGLYHTKNECNFSLIEDLPTPYNKPDFVIFQSFYQLSDVLLARKLRKKNIPYIIIPRGALTSEAQNIKKMKKFIGNFILFNKFAQKACAIQYLTKQEYESSGKKWNKNGYIIPNGIIAPKKTKTIFSKNKIIFTYIGRLAIKHKGLDLLLDAVCYLQDMLRENNCIFNLYGSDVSGSSKEIENYIINHKLNDLINLNNSIYGDEKEKTLLNTDIFILTSRFEGHPMALIEALSYSIPCFVTIGSNMKEEIEKFNAGWTAENNVISIIESLSNLIKEKDTLFEKSKNAKELSKEYEWSKIAKMTHNKLILLQKGIYK